jgi:hypothetical protein
MPERSSQEALQKHVAAAKACGVEVASHAEASASVSNLHLALFSLQLAFAATCRLCA